MVPLGRGSLVEESLYIFGGVMDRTRDTLHGNHNVVLGHAPRFFNGVMTGVGVRGFEVELSGFMEGRNVSWRSPSLVVLRVIGPLMVMTQGVDVAPFLRILFLGP